MYRAMSHLALSVIVCALFIILVQRSGGSKHIAHDIPQSIALTDKHGVEEEAEAMDAPEEFERYHREIRTRDGEAGPTYPLNYKMIELSRANNAKATSFFKYTGLPWLERGPGNVGGRTRGIIIDPDDPAKNTWYVGSVSGGIWKTTNAGTSWINKTPLLPNLATVTLAMAATNHNGIYAGTGEGFSNIDAVRGDGIWKSTDRGETWSQIVSTASNSDFSFVNRVIVDPANENIVLAATNTGIFHSTNGGSTWTTVYSGGGKIQQIIENPLNFNVLYATRNANGVLRSYNRGLNWSISSNGIGAGARCELAVSPADTARLFLAMETSSSISDLYVSDDGGSNWAKAVHSGGTPPNWMGTQGWYDNTIAAHPYDRSICFVGGLDMYKIQVTGGTRTTTRMTNGALPYVHVDHHNVTIIPVDKSSLTFRIVDGSDGGIGTSPNSGVSWTNPNTGYNTSQFYGVDKRPGVSQYVGGTQDNGTFLSPANPTATSAWTGVLGGDGFPGVWNYKDSNKLMASSQYNDLARSTNGGLSFSSAATDLEDVGSTSAPFISRIAKSNSDTDLLFVLGSSGIWRSDNFGENWTLFRMKSSDWGFGTGANAEISLADPQVVWAGVRMSNSGTTGKIHVSTDGGVSFSPTTNYTGATLGRLSGLATHPKEPRTAYALFSIAKGPKILRTTDLGQTWQDISGFGSGSASTNGFPDVATYCLLVMPHKPNEIWAGTEIGLFISTNNGSSWTYANDVIPAVAIWQMRAVDDEVVVATHGRGIWTVNIQALLNALPPVMTLSPRLNKSAQRPDGALSINISLRSPYDSTKVFVKGVTSATLAANASAKDTLVAFQVVMADSLTMSVTSYKNGKAYLSAQRGANVVLAPTSRQSYVDNFSTATANFTSSGFTLQTPSGFTSQAYHTPHPYADNRTYSLSLNLPIVVQPTNAFLRFDEIALVEPGEPGAIYGTAAFYDYVVVEATKDGSNWIPLEDGYDARLRSEWLTAFNSGTTPTASLIRKHEMNLLNKFSAGDVVFIRFRLWTDAGTTGWGWMIDNLEIQANLVSVQGEKSTMPTTFALSQNYPNPFNPSTTIRYDVPVESKVTLTIYDMLGRKVRTLVDRQLKPGAYAETWNASALASGTYYYRIDARDVTPGSGRRFSETKRLVLLR